jgi:hypothetical protein
MGMDPFNFSDALLVSLVASGEAPVRRKQPHVASQDETATAQEYCQELKNTDN